MQRPQPLQFSRFTTAAGSRGRRASQGSAASSSVVPSTSAQSAAGEVAYMSGCKKSRNQSIGTVCGTAPRIPAQLGRDGAARGRGRAAAPSAPSASVRGITVAGWPRRCTCTHMPASSASGRPMCRNTKSENRRSEICSRAEEVARHRLDAEPAPYNHSAVASAENCARVSHTSQ